MELDWVYWNKNVNNSEIYLYGKSLGGAIALYLGSTQKKHIKGLIIENTFTSYKDLVEDSFILGPSLKWFVSKSSWNSEELIKTIDLPILFISGRKDQAIPPAHMDRLFYSARKSKHKEMFKVEDGSHKDTWEKAGDEYFERISGFMEYESVI